jgi:hypothetical protein
MLGLSFEGQQSCNADAKIGVTLTKKCAYGNFFLPQWGSTTMNSVIFVTMWVNLVLNML